MMGSLSRDAVVGDVGRESSTVLVCPRYPACHLALHGAAIILSLLLLLPLGAFCESAKKKESLTTAATTTRVGDGITPPSGDRQSKRLGVGADVATSAVGGGETGRLASGRQLAKRRRADIPGGGRIASVDSTLVTTTSGTTVVPDVVNVIVDGGGGVVVDAGGGGKLARGESIADAAAPRSISALAWVARYDDDHDDWDYDDDHRDDDRGEDDAAYGIVAAFTDGTITSWSLGGQKMTSSSSSSSSGIPSLRRWEERPLVGDDDRGSSSSSSYHDMRESIADVSAVALGPRRRRRRRRGRDDYDYDDEVSDVWLVATASSKGIFLHASLFSLSSEDDEENDDGKEGKDDGKECEEEGEWAVRSLRLSRQAATSVQLQHRRVEGGTRGRCASMTTTLESGECYLFAGSASPRNNRVWVYTVAHRRSRRHHHRGPYRDENNDGTSSSWISLPLLSIDEPRYHGHLVGHQDWITCFSWMDLPHVVVDVDDDGVADGRGGRGSSSSSLLASSGHDAKIRLWKFTTRNAPSSSSAARDGNVPGSEGDEESDDGDSDEDEANVDDLEEEQGEARLTVVHSIPASSVTSISLEALLLGHEEPVTSLSWRRRRPKNGDNNDRPCLLSSSMDRTILLWMEEEGGAWIPISRVGSAGGILGGPIGSSLMGFVDAAFSPDGDRIAGHGYGGSVHFWTRMAHRPGGTTTTTAAAAAAGGEGEGGEVDGSPEDNRENDYDDDASLSAVRWVADPCITGHFRSVEDMAWDANGEYLLTTSSDQTTRLWAEVPTTSRNARCRWVEVGRPQVHGYDMTSITCIGGLGGDDGIDGDGDGEPCHRFVSGADEKVLRVFDAPASTLRLLRSISRSRDVVANSKASLSKESGVAKQTSSWRFERAFMPSLGLSNKATVDADQESSKYSGPINDESFAQALDSAEGWNSVELKLPSERDLGVTTLWPEARKLYGHDSELVCLDSYRAPVGTGESSLVASSCKARNDVGSAAIRLWDANKGKCVGILKLFRG
ncbi:hypothetical protein ACHAW5_001184 [Stephanodiscus triporus]|uniref:Elongator complex protein 2 n=1 Tax=Stephanodiscus triporus TaxID=2934178 RepID=A0ABD3QCP3_9STRA